MVSTEGYYDADSSLVLILSNYGGEDAGIRQRAYWQGGAVALVVWQIEEYAEIQPGKYDRKRPAILRRDTLFYLNEKLLRQVTTPVRRSRRYIERNSGPDAGRLPADLHDCAGELLAK